MFVYIIFINTHAHTHTYTHIHTHTHAQNAHVDLAAAFGGQLQHKRALAQLDTYVWHISCRSLCAKEPLIIGLFCAK